MCEAPARLAGLTGRKGAIAAGADADLLVFDDAATQTVTPEGVHHRHKVTPYAGETLRGAVHATYLRGQRVAEGGRALAEDRGALI
jgi:allantoinase